MDSSALQRMGEDTRPLSDYQSHPSQRGPPQPRGSSFSVPVSQSTSRQPSWPQFSIPTTGDSLSSGFQYDNRLQQLFVTPPMWQEFTFEILRSAKLSFEENKKAWGAGLASGTAGTFLLLFLGPVAGYYTGKAVHKRTVIEKARQRMLEDGKLNNTLRIWNEGAWAKRGFHTWIELPDEAGNVMNRADAKRFRIVIIPGSVVTTQLPMSSQVATPAEVELQGSGPLVQRLEYPVQNPVSQGLVQQISTPQIHQLAHQSHNQSIQHLPPPPQSFHQQPPLQNQRPIQQTYNHPPAPPSAPSFHQQPPSTQQTYPNSVTQSSQNPSGPQFYPAQAQQQQQLQNFPVSVAKQDENAPALPARVSTYQDGNQVHEIPNTEVPALFELPDGQSGGAKPVHYYEMDGESSRR